MSKNAVSRLSRQLTTSDAVVMGMCAMIGSGIFVAIAPAAASAQSGILISILIASFVAYCNATSSAQLAAIYPESGGTYVYGRRQLGHFWGWLAGWAFITGKIASCAAAALAFGYYLNPTYAKFFAIMAVMAITLVNFFGIQKSARLSWAILIVVLSVLGIIVFCSFGGGTADFIHFYRMPGRLNVMAYLQGAGIMFFAFAGYARIATLGEEVKKPRKTIPRAIVMALLLTVVVYLVVVSSVLLAIGPQAMAYSSAPLAEAIKAGKYSAFLPVVQCGAAVATLGALLSLILGISRTLFAMASDGQMPRWFSKVHPRYKVPYAAEFTVAAIIIFIVSIWDIRSFIGFSAFMILIYYAITNASAMALRKEDRLWPRGLSVMGFVFCAILALSLPQSSRGVGFLMISTGSLIYLLKKKQKKDL